MKSATGRTRPTREQTRSRILAAAFDVFAENGIAASTVNDVAAAAGMTKGAVYSSFASKDELVLAIMEEHAMERTTNALAAFSDRQDMQSAIREAGGVLVDAIRADAVWHRLLAEYYTLTSHNPDMRRALRERRREARAAASRGLSRMAEEFGVTLPLAADQFAVVIFALSNGLGIEGGIDPDAVPDDIIANVLTLLTRDMWEPRQ